MKVRGLALALTTVIVQGLIICQPTSAGAAPACSKRFKSALVLAGGGVTPGMALGMMAGARAAGRKPDVVISTCGASISTAIANAYQDPAKARAFVRSRQFHNYLLRNMQVGNTSPAKIGLKLMGSGTDSRRVPSVFSENVIDLPSQLPPLFRENRFSQGDTRYVTVAARALFDERHVGHEAQQNRLYQQTFFTDPDTAKSLKNLPASMKRNFPKSPIYPWTDVRTGVTPLQAARASISDPFLINPAKIKGESYFAGAMDLWPVETAQSIACDVTVSAPSGDYSYMEDLAVKRGFGFSQKERAKQLRGYRGVRWIRTQGATDYAMDPDIDGLSFTNKIPQDYNQFVQMIDNQYELGYNRAYQAYKTARPARAATPRRAIQ